MLPLRLAVIVLLVSCASPSLAARGAACGGHVIEWVGGAPGRAFDRGPQDHEPPSRPEPDGFDDRDRELWDAMIYNAYDYPTASMEHPNSIRGLPLEERRTMVMHRGEATSFRICMQSADESYTGQRLERYNDADWWARQVERFTNYRWSSDIEVAECSEGVADIPNGWVYIREGREGEVKPESIAHAKSWRRYDPHGRLNEWMRSEIVWHSADKVRDEDEEHFEKTLAHELGHVLGLWHTPTGSGFIMESGAPPTWPDTERWLAQWAYAVGPNVQYPGFNSGIEVPALPLVGVLLLVALFGVIGHRAVRRAS